MDDSKTVRVQLQKLVGEAGFSSIEAESSEAADKILLDYSVELILLDMKYH